jgi:hypothetical protein
MAEQGSRKRSVAAKPPPVEAARHYAPRGIAALLAPILRPALRRRGAALATLIEDWPAIAGAEIAARSLPVKCAAGTLTLACSGPDAVELQYGAPGLITRINLALGGNPVARLRFTDAVVPVKARSNRSVRLASEAERRGPALPARAAVVNLPDGPLGEALARLQRGLDRDASGSG